MRVLSTFQPDINSKGGLCWETFVDIAEHKARNRSPCAAANMHRIHGDLPKSSEGWCVGIWHPVLVFGK